MSWTVKNTGSLDGTLQVSIENVRDNDIPLSETIGLKIRVDGVQVTESPNLKGFPAYQTGLSAGQEAEVGIGWKFLESAGNKYQGGLTTFDVRFYMSAPIPDSEDIEEPIIEVQAIDEEVVEVLAVSTKEEKIEVLAIIDVLPFTGYDLRFIIASLALLFIGSSFILYLLLTKKKYLFSKK